MTNSKLTPPSCTICGAYDHVTSQHDRVTARDTIPHGTKSRYVNRKCRCVLCTRANAQSMTRQRRSKTPDMIPPNKHGTVYGYNYYHCRCPLCIKAGAVSMRNCYIKRKEKANKNSHDKT